LRPADSCDECPVTEANREFKESAAALLAKRVFKGKDSSLEYRWSLDSLIRTVEQIAGFAADAGETGTGENWTVVTARLVSIFRHEQYKARRIDDWNREQEREGAKSNR
jgi:hypothetical protein